MRRALLLAVVAAAFAGCDGDGGEEEGTAFAIEGRWEGRLTQRGIPPFRVTATIGSLQDPRRNTVRYTGIDCGGTWTYAGRDGDAYVFREIINRGASDACKGTGTVTLTPDGQRLRYEFRGGGVESRGTLIRAG